MMDTPDNIPLLMKNPGPKSDVRGDKLATSDHSESTQKVKYFSTCWATIFVLGDQLGVGVLALPQALSFTGWGGLGIVVLCGISQGIAAIMLARSWTIVIKYFPDEQYARHPYPLMGEKAFGNWLRIFISVVNGLAILGTCTIFLLLGAQSFQSIFLQAEVHISYCYWVLIIAAVLIPMSMFNTPKDFRFSGLTALCSIVLALIITLVLCFKEISSKEKGEHFSSNSDGTHFALAFGPMLYGYAGIGTYPTIQKDMEDPSRFPRVVTIGNTILTLTYILVGSVGYGTFGSGVEGNVLRSLPRGPWRVTAEAAAAAHAMAVFIIHQNPLLQDLEGIRCFHMPNDFSWKRFVLRTTFVLIVAFIALSLPNFNLLMDLVGSTLKVLLMFVAPCLVYWGMTTIYEQEFKEPVRFSRMLCVVMLLVGIAGGSTGTFAAVVELLSQFAPIEPCYVNITAASWWRS